MARAAAGCGRLHRHFVLAPGARQGVGCGVEERGFGWRKERAAPRTMVFGGNALEAPAELIGGGQPLGKPAKGAQDVTGPSEDAVDPQELLVENSRMRRQVGIATEKERRAQEENSELRRQVLLLQQQNAELVASHRRLEAEFIKAGEMAAREANVEGDPGMRDLKAGQEGYLDAKVAVLSERLAAIAKRSNWLLVQAEQARDQAADATRRQVDAERIVVEVMQCKGPGATQEYLRSLAASGALTHYPPSQLPTGSDIWKEDKAFAEGLPKTIPQRAARCAALVTSALANGQSIRSTVGRTVVMPQSSVAPTARPGNVWATLMNGGAAGARLEFA